MSELLTKEQIDLMLKDAASLKCFASNCDRIVGPVMFDCECHIKALACDHEKLRAVADAIAAWIFEESPSVAEQQAYDRIVIALEHAGYSL